MPPQPVPGSTAASGERIERSHASLAPLEPCGFAVHDDVAGRRVQLHLVEPAAHSVIAFTLNGVLGSNYFHYVRDPWGSFAEYSCDIDYIPKEQSHSPPTTSRGDSF